MCLKYAVGCVLKTASWTSSPRCGSPHARRLWVPPPPHAPLLGSHGVALCYCCLCRLELPSHLPSPTWRNCCVVCPLRWVYQQFLLPSSTPSCGFHVTRLPFTCGAARLLPVFDSYLIKLPRVCVHIFGQLSPLLVVKCWHQNGWVLWTLLGLFEAVCTVSSPTGSLWKSRLK